MDAGLLAARVRNGTMTPNEARAALGLLPWPDLGNWPPDLPAAPKRQRCSYCKFLAEGDRCRNCGAPQ